MDNNGLEKNNNNVNQETGVKVEQGKQSGMAIAALVCGIISICSCGIIFIPEILGIIFACIALKDKNRKQTMAKVGLVLSIISFVLFFFIMIILGSGDSATEESTTQEVTTEVETTQETTQEVTTEETNQNNESNDPNDLSNYYGKNVSLLEENMGISLEVDGKSYYSGTYYLDTDENNNIIGISMIYNPMIDETATFEGITMQDNIEEAASKLEANGYTLDEDDSIAAQVYKNQSGMVVSIMLTDEDEYVLNCMSESAYAESQQESAEENTGYYVTDTAYGDTIRTHVLYAYTENSWGSNMVRVECEITNISDDSITFNASDYYKLDNNGVAINVNSTDYDYKEISAGYSFKATLSFTCPENSNTDLSLMTMTADNLEFNLGDKPQNSEEMQEFAGTYNRSGNKIIILDNGDGTYNVQQIVTLGDETITNNYTNVTLDENNLFYLNMGAYLWSPDEYTIYSYDPEWDKIDDTQTPWVKN